MISEDMVRVAGVAALGSDAGRDAVREDRKNQPPISKRTGTAGATGASTVAWCLAGGKRGGERERERKEKEAAVDGGG